MPSEHPRLPAETHRSMLAHGGNRHMPLQAGEVAVARSLRRKPGHTMKIMIVAATCAVGCVGLMLCLT